ncbi:MAG: carboxypeptidase-like regulatory domain-containing protein [Prolixibacteraceae bacterium]|nr:carboxypeptidase-like regulatory domain-containing protein [Prolixibacteraceae bacterium]
MIFRILLPLFLFCTSIVSVFAQGIRGQITNAQGEPIPFANIYIPQLSTGTTSNIEGKYDLKLPEGSWKVLFQYLGYQTETRELTIGKTIQEINIQLVTQDYQIPEIKVLASGEDPAYYIMRRAIALAPYYQKQVSKYSCKVYLKGSGVFDKIPFLFEKQMKKDGVKENEAFVMETVSKIDFELPDKLKQQVLAMRSSGKDNNTSPMGMITNNLYDADKYGVVSPVGKGALKVYKFRLDGVFEDQGRTINKIKVIPKTNGNDVFSGYIYIADVFWNIHSADLKLHIPMTDVNVHQVYGEVNKNTWMPVSLDFDMDFSGMGFKMKFRYVASINEYKTTLNPALDHTFLDKLKNQQLQEQQMVEALTAEEKKSEQLLEKSKAQKRIEALMQKQELNNRETVKLNRLIEAEAERNSPPEPLEIKSTFQVSQKQVNNDSAYWASLRPIPLTESEKVSFVKKDSFLVVSAKPEFQDSLRDSKRKFKLKHLVVGKTYDYSVDSLKKYERFTIPSLQNPTLLSFNSVDGLRLELPFSYYKSDSTGHMKRFSPTFAYAFARKKLDAEFSYQQRLNGMKNSWLSISAGTTTSDYNRTSGLNTLTNDFYTIWLEENYKRFYRRDFLQMMVSRDLVNGLNLNATLDYSENSPLTNHSTYSFINFKDKEIQPNIPRNNTLLPWQMEQHQSLIGRLVLEYTPQHRYYIRNHTKIYAESKYPTYSLVYKGAFSGILGSDTRFDLVKIGMRQRLKFGIDDHFSYNLSAGAFLNSSRVYFEEYQHFNSQSTGFMFNNAENSFRLLPFYEYSTRKSFFEAHANWESRRFLLKQLPLIKNASFSENLFVNFLSTPELNNYAEIGYGLKRVFLLLNVEAIAGFENGKYQSAGIRVSVNLK